MQRAAPPWSEGDLPGSTGCGKTGSRCCHVRAKVSSRGQGSRKTCAGEPDLGRVNWLWAPRNKGNSTPSGSEMRWGRYPRALPPATEVIPCGDPGSDFSVALRKLNTGRFREPTRATCCGNIGVLFRWAAREPQCGSGRGCRFPGPRPVAACCRRLRTERCRDQPWGQSPSAPCPRRQC